MNITTCPLDPFLTSILVDSDVWLDWLVHIVLQSAYKAHHSPDTTLVKVFNDIMLNVDSGSCSLLILLDLSSAFDTIDYDLLCSVFEHHLSISPTALKLLMSFLTD